MPLQDVDFLEMIMPTNLETRDSVLSFQLSSISTARDWPTQSLVQKDQHLIAEIGRVAEKIPFEKPGARIL